MRFSLRTLLLFVTVLTVLLAGWYGYRRASMCQVKWLDPNSAEASALFRPARVERLDDGLYGFTYCAYRRHMQSLAAMLLGNRSGSIRIDGQSLQVSCEDEAAAQAQLAVVQAADTLKPGTFVIRGRVRDRAGRPLARATVDLLGSYVFINHFQTCEDGTFTMPLEDGGISAPAGSGYYLRVRAAEDSAENPVRWHTSKFALQPQHPERVAVIVISR